MNPTIVKCKNCRWWGRPSHDIPDHRRCFHPQLGSEYLDGFGTVDGEPFNEGAFASGPEFGCIHGESK